MQKKIFFIVLALSLTLTAFAQKISGQIMGKGKLDSVQLREFFVKYNPSGDVERAARLAQFYIVEADIEGVNHDVAFAQMILETGWLRFLGLVRADMNNFCGLGATSLQNIGHTFENEQIGVRAHVQHLKAYASKKPLNSPVVDPRYSHVSPKGKSPVISQLSGTWAVDTGYGSKIKSILQRMYQTGWSDSTYKEVE